jgi:hypothetical protein
MDRTDHPGTILYAEVVDGQETLLKVEAVAAVPDAMCFVATPDGPVPIVRVVAMRSGPARRIVEILEYGPEGRLLRATLAAPPPPGA